MKVKDFAELSAELDQARRANLGIHFYGANEDDIWAAAVVRQWPHVFDVALIHCFGKFGAVGYRVPRAFDPFAPSHVVDFYGEYSPPWVVRWLLTLGNPPPVFPGMELNPFPERLALPRTARTAVSVKWSNFPSVEVS